MKEAILSMLVISASLKNAVAYVDLFSLGVLHNNTMDYHAFKGFDAIQEPRYKQFRYGFPPGFYGSSIMPISLWFMLHGNYYPEGKLMFTLNNQLHTAISYMH